MNIDEHEADIAQDDLIVLIGFKKRLLDLINDIEKAYKANNRPLYSDFTRCAIGMEENLDEMLTDEKSRLQDLSGSLETYPMSSRMINWLIEFENKKAARATESDVLEAI